MIKNLDSLMNYIDTKTSSSSLKNELTLAVSIKKSNNLLLISINNTHWFDISKFKFSEAKYVHTYKEKTTLDNIHLFNLTVNIEDNLIANLLVNLLAKNNHDNDCSCDDKNSKITLSGCSSCHPNSCYRMCYDDNGNQWWSYDPVCCP